MSRPEESAPPQIWYGDTEAKKYTANSRIQKIQAEMTDRALELLQLPEDEAAFVLDIGCGSGLSGEILEESGHVWVGVDVAPSMLEFVSTTSSGRGLLPDTSDTLREVALEREVEGDLFLQDIGQGFGFRPGTFDGAISISVIQWLLNADASSHSPPQRLTRFFTTLHSALKNPSRAVFQFYPSSDDQVQLITSCAQRAGFGGGVVVDYPNSRKARKMYLCLMVGQQEIPKGRDGSEMESANGAGVDERKREEVRNERKRRAEKSGKGKNGKEKINPKDWILKKKTLYRTRGKEGVPRDSKYTARKRGPTF